MEWSPSQQAALQEFDKWRGSSAPLFVLAGCAGTGKSTIQKEIVSRLEGRCTLAAPTGKAALRLSQTSGQDASTIHKLIYVPYQDAVTKQLRFRYEERSSGSFLIVDEASMVNDRMASDLARTFSRIIYVGDPFQLPPVKAQDWFGSIKKNATLTEVHRQAWDSPILRLATRLREGQQVGAADTDPDHGLTVCPRSFIKNPETLRSQYDQIITGMNKTRSSLINVYRGAKAPVLPQVGERIINLMNCAEEDLGRYLPNGEQGTVVATHYEGLKPGQLPRISFETDSGELYEEYRFHRGYFDHHRSGRIDKAYPTPEWNKDQGDVLHLDFGAVITTHKSQGSQWDRVLFYDDGFLSWSKDLDERRRWLYTGFTRAAKELTWAM